MIWIVLTKRWLLRPFQHTSLWLIHASKAANGEFMEGQRLGLSLLRDRTGVRLARILMIFRKVQSSLAT